MQSMISSTDMPMRNPPISISISSTWIHGRLLSPKILFILADDTTKQIWPSDWRHTKRC